MRVHRLDLDAGDVAKDARGVPVTRLARTYLDLAATVRPVLLTSALEGLQLFDLRAVDDVLARHEGRPGARALAAAVATLRPEAEFTRSKLERVRLTLVRAAASRAPP